MAAMEKVLSSSMATVEWIEGDPMEVGGGIAWFAESSPIIAHMEEKWVEGENNYVGVPRHAMSRYAMQEWGDGQQFRKVMQTLDDRPCFCTNPLCDDKERWARWLTEHGGDEDMEHAERSWYLQSLHPMWNPTTRIEVIQYQLATYERIFDEEKEKQKVREAA